jgi:hypothetical protein
MARRRGRSCAGAAIGAEVVHAPHPAKTLATSKPWEARYVDALPTKSGFFFGPRVDMRLTELESIGHDIEIAEGCDGDAVDEDAKAVSGKKAAHSGHDEWLSRRP